eukprot:6962716-Pyramimonas_sp.AAC.1
MDRLDTQSALRAARCNLHDGRGRRLPCTRLETQGVRSKWSKLLFVPLCQHGYLRMLVMCVMMRMAVWLFCLVSVGNAYACNAFADEDVMLAMPLRFYCAVGRDGIIVM